MKRLGTFFLMGYFASGGVAQAATYYVSKAGSNNNSCVQAQSLATPKLTINAGIGCLAAGDTLFVRAGDYDEGLKSVPSGTSWNNKVRIAAYSGETVWMRPLAQLVGNPGAVIHFGGGSEHYIEFDGINMDGRPLGNGTILFTIDDIGEPHHIRVQNAEIIGNTDNRCCSTWGSSGIEIHGGRPTIVGGFEFRYLKIHGAGRPGNTNPDNGYGIYLAAPNNLIEYCDIYDNKGAEIHVYNDDGALPDNNIIRNNTLHDETRSSTPGQSVGILISGRNNQFYNNIIYNIRTSLGGGGGNGISVYNATDNKIWNNTVYGNATAGIEITSASTNTTVQNNIFYSNGINYLNAGANTQHDHNIDDGTNPGFTDASARSFALQSGSPARNTGLTIALVTTDRVGTARPQEGIADVGALEFQGSIAVPTAPTAPTGLRIIY